MNEVFAGKPFYLKETGELVVPNDGFKVFVAQNPADETAGFLGRNRMNKAHYERFYHVHLDYPSVEEEMPIIEQVILAETNMPPDTATQVARRYVEVANKIREAYVQAV